MAMNLKESNDLAPLQALITQWRERFRRAGTSEARGAYLRCAGELEAVAASLRQKEDEQPMESCGDTEVPRSADGGVPRHFSLADLTCTEHELKCWPEFYRELESGGKTFELRKDDRGFSVGDVLWLREWRRSDATYTGREMRRRVTFVLSGMGLQPGFVAMALAPVETEQSVLDASASQRTRTDDPQDSKESSSPALRRSPQARTEDEIVLTLTRKEAELLGEALVLVLQGDYSKVDELARAVRFDYTSGAPRVSPPALRRTPQARTEDEIRREVRDKLSVAQGCVNGSPLHRSIVTKQCEDFLTEMIQQAHPPVDPPPARPKILHVHNADLHDAAARAIFDDEVRQIREALTDLWTWATESRTHLDTDPVPDGLGAEVLAALDLFVDPPPAREER